VFLCNRESDILRPNLAVVRARDCGSGEFSDDELREGPMNLNKLIGSSLLATSLCFSAFAQGLPKAGQPQEVGFSAERLVRLSSVFQSDVDKGVIPGAVIMIARSGKVAYFEAIGFQDREKGVPMKTDAIFRIASMTKPITSVALMLLVEEGKIQIDDPLALYLLEFKNLKVGVETTASETGQRQLAFEAVKRDPTIQDLLRHTSGFTYDVFGDSLVKRAYQTVNIRNTDQTLAEFTSKLAKLPLAYQPGSTWEYSLSTDVLGRVIEVVSGVPFDQFVSDRILKPLKMDSTGFFVPVSESARLAEPQVDPITGKRPIMLDATRKPNWLSGGGGMVSTAADYVRFSQMLLNGGELDGARILSPSSVAFMTADHLPPGTPIGLGGQFGSLIPDLQHGQGFGLGFAVRVAQGHNPYPGSVGEFYWVGATGTAFWVDPKEKLIAIMMVQLPLAQGRHYRSLVRNLVYQALLTEQ
jgi:CubicO group peptidase (beta-lactamase class C family)